MRRASLIVGGTATALLLAVSAQGRDERESSPAQGRQPPPVRLDASKRNRLVLTTVAYRLSLSKDNGSLIELVDRRTGERLLRGQDGCTWAVTLSSSDGFGACAYGRTGEHRFTWSWARAASRLTLRYAGGRAAATVTLVARSDHADLRLTLEPRFERPIATVFFPGDLVGDTTTVGGVYTPTFLPGVRLLPSFFSAPRRNVERYPSRWAFADYLAADVGRSHVALYSVNPPPAAIAPVDVGVIHAAGPGHCSGSTYCLTHAFQTWLMPGATWSSPLVRLRVGGSVEQSIVAYRRENGIDGYPSLADKLGARLDVLSRAPLVKADLWKGLPPFADWGPSLRRLPSPALLHPVAFQPRGHDEDYPDFLPPDARWGTTAAFNGALDDARSLGHLVMPYLNVSWWDTQSPSVRTLPAPLRAVDIAMQTPSGQAVTEQFGEKDGYIMSPHAPFVRDRVARLFEEWGTHVPVECLFFDQIGARPWRRDFNPAAPSPIGYQDGWIASFERFRDRCLMTEDGWDRLADAFVGFHGGLLQMQREHRWPDERFGEGSWEPYPLALWLLHDKVLLYQHDLYEGTMTADPEALLFNVAFGMMLSYNWDVDARSLKSPWLGLVGEVQRVLGPATAGRAMTGYRRIAPEVTVTELEGYSVIANWSRTSPYEHDGYRIAPFGFLARDGGGRVLAAALGDTWAGVTVPG